MVNVSARIDAGFCAEPVSSACRIRSFQIANLVQHTQSQLIRTVGILLAWIFVVPFWLAIGDRQMDQPLPFDRSMPMPDSCRRMHSRSFSNRNPSPILKLDKPLPLRHDQHLFTGVVMPLGIRAREKLHKTTPLRIGVPAADENGCSSGTQAGHGKARVKTWPLYLPWRLTIFFCQRPAFRNALTRRSSKVSSGSGLT